MNERLTIQDLTDLLADKHSMTKKDAEAFVKEFFLLIEQSLQTENIVKIKGLGTFKLIDVDSRESVNVNTGERFQIKGHTKVSFTPDASLRDTVNRPFAHFETVVLNENTILEDTPIEEEEEENGEELLVPAVPENEDSATQEVEDDIVEHNLIPETTETVEVTTDDTSKTEKVVEEEMEKAEDSEKEEIIDIIDNPVAEENPIIEEVATVVPAVTENAPVQNRSIQQQPIPEPTQGTQEITAENIIAQELIKAQLKPEVSSKKETPQKEKSPVPYLVAIIIIVLLLCGGAILFIYYPDLFSSSTGKDTIDMPVTTQPVRPETQLTDTVVQNDSVTRITPETPKEEIKTQQIAKEKEVTAAPIINKETPAGEKQPSTSVYTDSATYKITGTKTSHTIKEGETLTRVSLHFYGTKAMWPYILKHNPGVIKNPNNVPYGTTIKIPELTKE